MAQVPSNPGWFTGYVPSAVEWAAEWASKVDFPAPIWQGGTGAQEAPLAYRNLQQRLVIDASLVTPLVMITDYWVKTSSGASTLLLPPIGSVSPGDWVYLLDLDNSAATNIITVQANGSDQISLYGNASNTKQINTNSGAAVLISDGTRWRMWSTTAPAPPIVGTLDGTEVWTVTKNGVPESVTSFDLANYSSGAFQPIQWAVWFNQTPGVSELLALYTPALPLVFPSGLSGSVAVAPVVNPTASFVLNINKIVSGSPTVVGTITVSTVGAVSFSSTGFSTNVGDQLSITGPASPDATISGFSATLKASVG